MRSDIEIVTVRGAFDFQEIIDPIRDEWPGEWGEKTDAELVRLMADSYNPTTDTLKLLRDDRGANIGFLRYTRWPRDAVRTVTVHLLDITVERRARRKGLASALMRDMLAECRKTDIRWIVSRTLRSNDASIALHERFGFAFDFETDNSIVWRRAVE